MPPIAKHFSFTHAELSQIAEKDPALAGQIAAGLEVERITDERQRCENSLIEFLIAAWPHMGEAGELAINWHHEVIARNLEAQARGEIKSLVINVPPRCSKTSLCSIVLPAWIWAQPDERWAPLMGPHVRFFCLSYKSSLATDIAIKQRRLVMGDWYQSHWGKQVQIRDDQQARDNFANTRGGERLSHSIEGGVLGRGGDWQLVDDPHSTQGAESDLERMATLEGMRNLVTRVTDPRIAARLLIMQRLHVDDSTNYTLENWPKVRHLMLPMKFDPRRADPEDPRTEEGELLWPEVMTPAFVRQEERELTDYGKAGQLQQEPTSRGGNIIQRDWWRLWPEDYPEAPHLVEGFYRCIKCAWSTHERIDPNTTEIRCDECGGKARYTYPYPAMDYCMVAVDTAYGEKQENSWSAATVWGVWRDIEGAPRAMLMHTWRGRPRLRGVPDSPDPRLRKGLVEHIYEIATRWKADLVLIEQKTRGTDLYQELEVLSQEWPFALAYDLPAKSKEIRLEACVPLFTNERVWAPETDWAETVINEVASAPGGKYNDLCDTVSAALRYLRNNNLLSLGEEFRREERRKLVFRGKKERGGTSIRELYET